MAETRYFRPDGIAQALSLAREYHGDYIYSAGGTDVQISRKLSLLHKSVIIDLSELASLRGITITDHCLTIGSMTTLDDLISSSEARTFAPLAVEAARSIATPVIRMTATVGGNVLVANRCTFYNQSVDWRVSAGSCLRDCGETCLATNGGNTCYSRNVSDLAPALLALDANVSIRDCLDERTVPLVELYASDGIRYHAGLENGAVVTAIHLALRPERWWYRKLRRRASIDFSSLTFAAAWSAGHIRMCLNGISMAPVLITGDAETSSAEELSALARRRAKLVGNDLMPLDYRRDMISVYIKELWEQWVGESKDNGL